MSCLPRLSRDKTGVLEYLPLQRRDPRKPSCTVREKDTIGWIGTRRDYAYGLSPGSGVMVLQQPSGRIEAKADVTIAAQTLRRSFDGAGLVRSTSGDSRDGVG